MGWVRRKEFQRYILYQFSIPIAVVLLSRSRLVYGLSFPSLHVALGGNIANVCVCSEYQMHHAW